MSVGGLRASVVLCATALLAVSAARGASLLTPFNAIVSGNFYDGGSDLGGGIAVEGTANVPSYWSSVHSMNGELITDFPNSVALYLPNAVTGGPFQPSAGVYYDPNGGVSGSGTSTRTTTNPATANPSYFSFATFQTESTEIGNEVGTAITGANPTVSVHAGLNVFTMTAAEAAALGSISFVAQSGATFATSYASPGNAFIIINIAGTNDTLNLSGGTYYTPFGGTKTPDTADVAFAEDVLYNFYQMTTSTVGAQLTLGNTNTTIAGSVLAPGAAVTGGADMCGSLIAASFTGANTEFHNLPFMSPTFTPEPAPLAGVGLGLIALAFIRRRRTA
jgi:choice-of-anchor A domain-containing protein